MRNTNYQKNMTAMPSCSTSIYVLLHFVSLPFRRLASGLHLQTTLEQPRWDHSSVPDAASSTFCAWSLGALLAFCAWHCALREINSGTRNTQGLSFLSFCGLVELEQWMNLRPVLQADSVGLTGGLDVEYVRGRRTPGWRAGVGVVF